MIRRKSKFRSGKVAMRFGLLAAAALSLSACQLAEDDETTGLQEVLSLCPGFAETGEVEAVTGAECGRLEVLENPADPKGRRIQLNIIRLPAISNVPAPDPLFVLAGGPGQAATDFAGPMAQLLHQVRKKRDIVLVDQRGTGESSPLDCEVDSDEGLTLSDAEFTARSLAQIKSCLASYDAAPEFYTTPFAMDDLDAVREALGYEQINLWGASYGTRAALVYMRRHPEHLRSAVLDGNAPSNMLIPLDMAKDAEAALDAVLEICESDPACLAAMGELKPQLATLLASLKAEPRLVKVVHPVTQTDLDVLITPTRLLSNIRLALYMRDLAPLIPLSIKRAIEGDFQLLSSMMLLAGESVEDGMSRGMQLSILCAEDYARLATLQASGQIEEEKASMFYLNAVAEMQDVCAMFPPSQVPESYYTAVVSDAPALVLSGSLDPVTPPRWGELVTKSLSNSRHVVVGGGHHGVSFLGCMPDVIANFIASADAQSLDLTCVEKIKAMPPFLNATGPRMNVGTGKTESVQP